MPLNKSEREFLAKQFDEIKTRLSVLEDFINSNNPEEVNDDFDVDLYNKLKVKRTEFADGAPAFTVCSNFTLEDLSRQKPLNIDDIKKIHGIKDYKALKYGQGFINVIKEHVLGS